MFGVLSSFHPNVCIAQSWQRRGFRVRSAAAVASTSLPTLRDTNVGVKRGQNPQTLGWRRLFRNVGVKRGQTPNIGGFRLLPQKINCRRERATRESGGDSGRGGATLQLLRLNAFRGEPASSRFEWHFTPNHNSSANSSTSVGLDLHLVSPKLHPGHG